MSYRLVQFRATMILFLCIVLMGCGSGGATAQRATPATITISNPTTGSSFSTTWSGAIIGGTISGASAVWARNGLTGSMTEGYVTYFQGHGTWFAELSGLGLGDNPITVTTENAAEAHVTITRPLQPLNLVFNGADASSASSYWTDGSSFMGSHKIALFADGTGKSTTGSTVTESAGAVSDFTWSRLGPDIVEITGCTNCSFQKISRVQGSLGDGQFDGQVTTINGAGYISLDAFILTAGSL